MRVVFMGTPDFAAASLNELIENKYDLAAVYTQPDKMRGRGMSVSYSPVKELALKHDLPVYQPENLRDGSVLSQMQSLAPDILVVVAYGRILPDELLTVARYGAINVHGSLLPKYRGSAPIQWAVLNGDRETGVSTMYLAHDMDAGDVIYSEKTEIGETETSGELFERLMGMGARLLVKTLRAIEAGTAPRHPQDHSLATYTKKLDKSLSPLDWNQTPRAVLKQIYGLQPWPVASTMIGDINCKVYAAAYSDTKTTKAPGEIVHADREGILFSCLNGETLRITEVQAPGKRRMAVADYLRGHPLIVT